MPRNRLHCYDIPFEALTIFNLLFHHRMLRHFNCSQIHQIIKLKYFLIVSDSQSTLCAISSLSFDSSSFPFIFLIKSALSDLYSIDSMVEFIWILSHAGISGNEMVDYLAISTNTNLRFPIFKILATDFLTPFKLKHNQTCQRKWASSAANFVTWYRYITSTIPSHKWFHNLSLSRRHIVQFSQLRLGHNLLPAHAFHLSLNHSPSCTHHNDMVRCDFNHIIKDCPSLVFPRRNLFQFLSFNNISPIDSHNILNSQFTHVILVVLKFIIAAGYSS